MSTATSLMVDDTTENNIIDEILYNDNGELKCRRDKLINLTEDEKRKIKDNLKFEIRIGDYAALNFAYNNDFEEYRHGIMSAFLLIKNLKCFNSIYYFNYNKVYFKDINFSQFIAKQSILRAVSDHTSSGFTIKSLNGYSSFLTFVDELEEFSRISRAAKNREFVTEFCKSDLYFEDGVFNINFIFDNKKIHNLNPERAFKGRCERFLSLFNIPKLDDNFKIELKCIDRLQEKEKVYSLSIAKRFAKITIDDEEMYIPSYLESSELYSRQEYEKMK